MGRQHDEAAIRELIDAGNFLVTNPLGLTPGAVKRWGRAVNAVTPSPAVVRVADDQPLSSENVLPGGSLS